MVDTPLADMGRGRRPWWPAPSLGTHLLGAQMPDVQGVVASDRTDQLAVVEDVHDGRLDTGDDDLPGQVPTDRDALIGHADAAIAAHDPGDLGQADRPRPRPGWWGRRRHRGWRCGGAVVEPLSWRVHAKRLMRPAAVVAGDPGVQDLLRLVQVDEAPTGQQLGPQRLVDPLNLAGGGRAADPGAPMGDAVLAADAVKPHLGRVRAEPAGEDLPLSVSTSSGTP